MRRRSRSRDAHRRSRRDDEDRHRAPDRPRTSRDHQQPHRRHDELESRHGKRRRMVISDDFATSSGDRAFSGRDPFSNETLVPRARPKPFQERSRALELRPQEPEEFNSEAKQIKADESVGEYFKNKLSASEKALLEKVTQEAEERDLDRDWYEMEESGTVVDTGKKTFFDNYKSQMQMETSRWEEIQMKFSGAFSKSQDSLANANPLNEDDMVSVTAVLFVDMR
jgi:hypothetical protein